MTSGTDIYEDDIFQSSAPPIVDADVLEAAKENIQPLASGRRVTALAAVFSTPHAQRDAHLKVTRARLRAAVTVALEDVEESDSDPLEAYCRFVYWTVENYPQGHSAESGLLELLEEATRVLKDEGDGRWRGDLKYLKLWVLYASYVEKPAIIYAYLLTNEIGAEHALLYEEYAAVLERDGRRTDADSIYLLGIARNAFPTERLQSRHREFQKRMMSAAPLPSPTPSPTADSASKRTVLGTTTSPATTITPSASSSTSVAQPTSNARLQIFVDPSPETPQAGITPWPDLGTRKTRVKENVPEVRTAGGTTLRQAGRSKRIASSSSSTAGSAGKGGGSKIVPFRDPDGTEENQMPPPPVPPKTPARIVPFCDTDSDKAPSTNVAGVPATPKFTPFRDETSADTLGDATPAPAPGSVMKVKMKQEDKKKGGMTVLSEAEALRKDPFKNYRLADGEKARADA